MTVTAPNYLPYESTIPVFAHGPYVQIKSFTADGSPDGYIQPGSDILMDVWFKNYGTEPGSSLTSILRSGSSHIVITDSTLSLPDLAPNDSVLVEGAFSLQTDTLLENGDVITRSITVKKGIFGKGKAVGQFLDSGSR